MPSTTVETLGSAAIEKLIVPTPRMTIALLALVVPLRKVTEGTSDPRSSRLRVPASSSASPLNAVIEIGTS